MTTDSNIPDTATIPPVAGTTGGVTGPTPGSRATGVAAGLLSPEAPAVAVPEYTIRWPGAAAPAVDLQGPAEQPAVSSEPPALQPEADAALPASEIHEEPAPVQEQLPVGREEQAEASAQERLAQLVRNVERILSQSVGVTSRPTALRNLRAGRLIAGAIAEARGRTKESATAAFVADLRARGVELVIDAYGRRGCLSFSGPATEADLREITRRTRAIRRFLRAESLR